MPQSARPSCRCNWSARLGNMRISGRNSGVDRVGALSEDSAPMMTWLYHLLRWGSRNNPKNADCLNNGVEADTETAEPVTAAPLPACPDTSAPPLPREPYSSQREAAHPAPAPENPARQHRT